MLDNSKITVEKKIKAKKEIIWDAFINPDKIKQYLFGTETLCDWAIGSEIIFQGEYQGIAYRDKGVILNKIENNYLEYSYWSGFTGLADIPENYAVVKYTISENDDTCIVTIEQLGFASEESRKHAEVTWQNVLNDIENLCQNN